MGMALFFDFAYLIAWMLLGAPFLAAVGFFTAYFIEQAKKGAGSKWMLITGCIFVGLFTLVLVFYREIGIYLFPF